jgi:hypothetical protein
MVLSMARVHLFELHDQGWFPVAWRDLLTDYLAFYAEVFRPYRPTGPVLAAAMRRCGATSVVDLCSGGGAALLTLLPALEEQLNTKVDVTLTDKYPNPAAWQRRAAANSGSVSFSEQSVDAASVPDGLAGFRTLFTSLHHFRPEEARGVLADAAASGSGIAAFEYTERNWLVWGPTILLIPLFLWLVTPFMRPLTWRRLLWTYLLPVVPLVAAWDGFVSCLRTYSVAELEALVESLPPNDLEWEVGRLPSFGASRVTYLIATPPRRSGEGPTGSPVPE